MMDERTILQLPLKRDCPEPNRYGDLIHIFLARRLLMRNKATSGGTRDDSSSNENQTFSAAPG